MTEKDKIRKYEQTAEATDEEQTGEIPEDFQADVSPTGEGRTDETDAVA